MNLVFVSLGPSFAFHRIPALLFYVSLNAMWKTQVINYVIMQKESLNQNKL